MSPANLLQIAGLNPLLEMSLNLSQEIRFQILENYFNTSKARLQELLIAKLQKVLMVAKALSAVNASTYTSRDAGGVGTLVLNSSVGLRSPRGG